MKKALFILLILPIFKLTAQNLTTDLQAVYDNYNLMGLSVWVSVDGQESSYHYGLRDFDRNLPINSETQFRIASISKMFTALGLLKLYDDGLFALDDDISDVMGYQIRNPLFPDTPITYRMLLSHQSSLQDGSGYNVFLSATYNQNPIPNISEVLLPGGDYYTSDMWRTELPNSYFAYSNINFGLIATLIEKISSQRFDEFMKTEILEPLAIEGSYNIHDLNDINNLAVLYRYNNGWIPQWDNYQGVMPPPPDLSNYIPGTNGVYFSPQGGLRISATEIGSALNFLQNDGLNSSLSISKNTIQEMKNIAWDYNGANGDNYFGLFNRWGLGIHHANVNAEDQICNLGNYSSFLGHPGEAYGLVSDAYFTQDEPFQFSLLINGIRDGYVIGSQSSYYTVEESIFEVLCTYFEKQLSISEENKIVNSIAPNPANESFTLHLATATETLEVELLSLDSKVVFSEQFKNSKTITINTKHFSEGIYFLKVSNDSKSKIFKILIQKN